MTVGELLKSDAVEAAPALLGWTLLSNVGSTPTAGLIVETEAYLGSQDPASHAYRGPTPRTQPMFGPAGTVYVYLSYGLHYCLNLVTGPMGEAQAVLIRALQPVAGVKIMQQRRGSVPARQLCQGPANLTKALGIDKTLSGSLIGRELQLEPPAVIVNRRLIKQGPRVGISAGKDLPWRFWLEPDKINGSLV